MLGISWPAQGAKLRTGGIGKRLLDLSLAAVGIVLAGPLWLLIPVAIKLDDGGPVFYKQQRWGRNARAFQLIKFRTMVRDSDASFGITQAAENDARITRVGQLLRGTGMDELPQLINILKGDMSLVGPRALARGEIVVDETGKRVLYEEWPGFRKRLEIRPGLTGLATVYIPKDAHPQEKLNYDLRYIEERSFWLDVKLIAASLLISFRGRWEARGRKF